MIEVEVKSLTVEQDYALILLQGKGNDFSKRRLSMPISLHQAHLITLKLDKVDIPRPLTHDLTANIIKLLKAKLISVRIYEQKDEIFYGKAQIESEGETLEIDVRPSDAITLALTANSPIYVSDELMAPTVLTNCPVCGGDVRYLNDTDAFCLNCDWDNLPKIR
jgi:bifunctional DNase/RNase